MLGTRAPTFTVVTSLTACRRVLVVVLLFRESKAQKKSWQMFPLLRAGPCQLDDRGSVGRRFDSAKCLPGLPTRARLKRQTVRKLRLLGAI